MKLTLFVIVMTALFGSGDLSLKLPASKIEKKKGKIQLTVMNNSSDTLYYNISLAVKVDTGWRPIVGDIKSIGENAYMTLRPIPGKKTQVVPFEVGRISPRYLTKGKNEMRLGLAFSRKGFFVGNKFEYKTYEFTLVN